MNINSPPSPLCNLSDWMSHCTHACIQAADDSPHKSWERAVRSSRSVSDPVQYVTHPVGIPDLLIRHRKLPIATEAGGPR